MSDAGNYGMGEFGHGSLSCRLSFQVPIGSVAVPGRCAIGTGIGTEQRGTHQYKMISE